VCSSDLAVASHFNVYEAVAEPLVLRRSLTPECLREAVRTALSDVQLPTTNAFLSCLPHQLSGGELQRLSIARALTLRPALLVADEPTAALDSSVQAKVLRLLLDLQERYGLALLLVTHDLRIARRVADRILCLREGALEDLEARHFLSAGN
jgi:peptide/nickel transport system ATP-binding protein